jgi:hypothetical protein
MRKSYLVIISTAVVALALSATPKTSHVSNRNEAPQSPRNGNHPCSQHHLAGDVHSHLHSHHDHSALADMHAFAAHHYGIRTHAHEHTFGSVLQWSPEWELRWVDYATPQQHIVRVYHATKRHDPRSRFISTWNHADGHYEPWHPLH